MREIKFRAWNKRNKKMRLDFAIGSSGEILETGHSCDEDCLGVEDVTDDWIAGDIENEIVWNVMQFTGLFDAKGKEIFEGDVIKNTGFDPLDNVVVKFEHGVFVPFHMVNPEKYWEVIGNIYENPELLIKASDRCSVCGKRVKSEEKRAGVTLCKKHSPKK